MTLGALYSPMPAAAQAPDTPILTINRLKYAGGPVEKGPDGRTLDARLTEALQQYLSEVAGNHFHVAGTSKSPRSKVRLTLEGELSRVGPGGSETEGSFLCVLRLYREGNPRLIIGQWAGTAQTLRELTGNIRQDKRFDKMGLMGELSKRVAAAVSDTASMAQAAAFSALVEAASKNPKRIEVVVLSERPGGQRGSGLTQVVIGDKYRVEVKSPEAGSVYIVALGPGGRPQSLFVPGQEAVLTPNMATLVPSGAPLSVNGPPGATEQEIVVLVRQKSAGLAAMSPEPVTTRPLEIAAKASLYEPDVPVQVVGGGDDPPIPADTGIARLLAAAAGDPPGTWIAQKITLQFAAR
jgi:hypothetical protein